MTRYRSEQWGRDAVRFVGVGVFRKFEANNANGTWKDDLRPSDIVEMLEEAFEAGQASRGAEKTE